VLSANRSNLLSVIVFGKSFMNMMKRRGPRILPWGAPDSIDKKSEKTIIYRSKLRSITEVSRAKHYLKC